MADRMPIGMIVEFDQRKQQAIESLKKAKSFVVFASPHVAPPEDEQEGDGIEMFVAGSLGFASLAHEGLCAQVSAMQLRSMGAVWMLANPDELRTLLSEDDLDDQG